MKTKILTFLIILPLLFSACTSEPKKAKKIDTTALPDISKGLERIKDMGVAGVIGTIVTILSNVLFLLVWKLGLPGFFSASILGQAIPAVYLAVRVKIWKYIGTVIDKTLQKEMRRINFL